MIKMLIQAFWVLSSVFCYVVSPNNENSKSGSMKYKIT